MQPVRLTIARRPPNVMNNQFEAIVSGLEFVTSKGGGSLQPVMEQFKVPLFLKGRFRGISVPSKLFKSPPTPLFLLWGNSNRMITCAEQH